VRIRVAPTNLPSSAAEVAEKLNYMPVETWRKDDLVLAASLRGDDRLGIGVIG
jgi:hypothetical protein